MKYTNKVEEQIQYILFTIALFTSKSLASDEQQILHQRYFRTFYRFTSSTRDIFFINSFTEGANKTTASIWMAYKCHLFDSYKIQKGRQLEGSAYWQIHFEQLYMFI